MRGSTHSIEGAAHEPAEQLRRNRVFAFPRFFLNLPRPSRQPIERPHLPEESVSVVAAFATGPRSAGP
jgi:hypothetical protein